MSKVITDGIVYEEGQEPRLVEKRDITGPQFTQTQIDAGDFNVWRVTASAVGDVVLVSPNKSIIRSSENIRTSVVTRGARKYESLRKRFLPIIHGVGSFNTDLPDIEIDDRYLVTAMTADTEYHCVSRKDFSPYTCRQFNLSAGSTLEIPAGSNAMVCGDEVSIYSATAEARNILLSTDSFGLIFV